MFKAAHRWITPDNNPPERKRVPFCWKVASIVPDNTAETKLWWKENEQIMSTARFRLCVAVDVREEKVIELFTLQTKKIIGTLDIRFASVFQVYESIISRKDSLALISEGLGMRMVKGKEPLWFFIEGSGSVPLERSFKPHLLENRKDLSIRNLQERISTLASLQQFGWMEGCVLDGLMDLGYTEAAMAHLSLFMDREKTRLVYEDPRSVPVDGQFYGIESLLPIAIMAKVYSHTSILKDAVQYMESKMDEKGAIRDKTEISAEGNYTIAYPLACLARVLDRDDLAIQALYQLSIRKEVLWRSKTLYLRFNEDGNHTFKHWGRAHVWYLLGMIRTLKELKEQGRLSNQQEEEWKGEFTRAWDIAWSFRNNEGVWSCFVDDSTTGFEASTTAGIAAATAIGINMGYLSRSLQKDLDQTFHALCTCLTPDGFVACSSQANKGGEELQRSGYRVLSQVSMGLSAQFVSAQSGWEETWHTKVQILP